MLVLKSFKKKKKNVKQKLKRARKQKNNTAQTIRNT